MGTGLMKVRMGSSVVSPFETKVTLPVDKELPDLPLLFDSQWVWQAFGTHIDAAVDEPQRFSIQKLQYWPGRRALASYVVEWPEHSWIADDQFTVELVAKQAVRLFRYPLDPYLPGLRCMASPLDAPELLTKYVRLHSRHLRVDLVRYRPAARAVLRHIVSHRWSHTDKVTLFVKVMPPERVSRLWAAAELAKSSEFVLPQLAGCWADQGVVWQTCVPGKTVGRLIRQGNPPEPDLILDHLARLWSGPVPPDKSSPSLAAGFRLTRRILSRLLQERETYRLLQGVADILGPFAEAWQPRTLAHNDFYDDQMLLTPTGRVALVDFEEIGLGDPLLDVGTLLAHLRWGASLGTARQRLQTYRSNFRCAALERFGWDERELDLREAFALFRLSTNPLHRLHRDWLSAIETGLSLAAEALNAACPANR